MKLVVERFSAPGMMGLSQPLRRVTEGKSSFHQLTTLKMSVAAVATTTLESMFCLYEDFPNSEM